MDEILDLEATRRGRLHCTNENTKKHQVQVLSSMYTCSNGPSNARMCRRCQHYLSRAPGLLGCFLSARYCSQVLLSSPSVRVSRSSLLQKRRRRRRLCRFDRDVDVSVLQVLDGNVIPRAFVSLGRCQDSA